ncbi:MAG: hypothetical protein IJE29_06800 [Firmicutes bacterium]|nr:hypothetical protein [Bacillota bacterium]
MKKKFLSLTLAIGLLATAAIGGTLAYFTDTDSAENVMTTGSVNILQNEKDRYGADFKDNVALMPMVDARAQGEADVVDGYFNTKMNNVVDKIVTVTNEAAAGAVNKDAYVRTILAFETNTEYQAGTNIVLRNGKAIFDAYIGTLGDFKLLDRDTVKINGVEYVLAVKVYADPLAPANTTAPSLKQIFLSPDANNEVETLFGDTYTILALSQGTQTAGFDSSEQALNAAFGILDGEGKVTDEKLIEWLSASQNG